MAIGDCSAVVNRIRRRFGPGAVAGLPEWQLVERFAATGDEAAFEAIVARFGPMILGVCRRVLCDEADIEDVFQATFLVLVRKSRTLGGHVALGQWLYGVAYRVALRARSEARRRRTRERLGPSVDGPDYAYEDDPARFDVAAVLDDELSRLSTKYRAPIVLCYFEGLTHEEAARRLGWPVGSVKGRLARARDLLRHRLTRRGLTLSTAALAAALAGEAAPVPVALALRTSWAAVQIASGKGGNGAIAVSVAALLRQALRSLFLTQCQVAGAGLLVLVAGAGLLISWAKTPVSPPVPPASEAAARSEAARDEPGAKNPMVPKPPGTPIARRLPNETPIVDLPRSARHETTGPSDRDAAAAAPAVADVRTSSPLWIEYDALRAKTGPGADAQVRLALWCEEHGLTAQRHQHLAKAVVIEPGNVLARGLMGRVGYQGRWVVPEAAAAAVKSEGQKSATLAEYNARREKLDDQAAAVKARVAEMEKRVRPAALAAYRARHRAHNDLALERLKLGLWCEKAGLEAEATVEFSTAIHLDRRIDEAWRHLGYVRRNGRWMLEAQAAALD